MAIFLVKNKMPEYKAEKTSLIVILNILKPYESMENIGEQKWTKFTKRRKEAKQT